MILTANPKSLHDARWGVETPDKAHHRRERRFLHTSFMAGGGEYNTRKGNKPARLCPGFYTPATRPGRRKPSLWRVLTLTKRLSMTLPKGRAKRPQSTITADASGPLFTQLVCAMAIAMHARAAWAGPGEWVIRTNRAELQALRFAAECAKSFSERG